MLVINGVFLAAGPGFGFRHAPMDGIESDHQADRCTLGMPGKFAFGHDTPCQHQALQDIGITNPRVAGMTRLFVQAVAYPVGH